MCQPVTVRLVFKIKTNYYFRCLIWHADIGQNNVNYYYKNQDTKWYKILNQIWKRIDFKMKVFQNEEKIISTANIFEKCIVSFWSGLKTNMRRCRCSWEIICCKAFLRRVSPHPLPRAMAGGWDITGRRKQRKTGIIAGDRERERWDSLWPFPA